MKKYWFIVQSLLFYKKQHFLLGAAIIIASLVISGSIIIGDSVKGSLQALANNRLGDVGYIFSSGERFFSAELHRKLASGIQEKTTDILYLRAFAANPDNEMRANNVNVYVCDSGFLAFWGSENIVLNEDEIIINQSVAAKLNLKPGDELIVKLQKPQFIPLNAPFASEANRMSSGRYKVKYVLADDKGGLFSLRNSQASENSIFINRNSALLDTENRSISNLLLISNANEFSDSQIVDIQQKITNNFTLSDYGLALEQLTNDSVIQLSSNRIFMDTVIVNALQSANYNSTVNCTYLINNIEFSGQITPYSFVCATETEKYGFNLNNNEIVVNKWLATDLNLNLKDTIKLTYWIVNQNDRLVEETEHFIVKYIISDKHAIADAELMPNFPGLSDAGNCRDWDAGVAIDFKAIRDKDEAYWDEYKGTPKGFINLEKGKELWSNKFGFITGLRFSVGSADSTTILAELKSKLSLEKLGFSVISAMELANKAAIGSVDFTQLFLSLGFFIIVAALVLIYLIYGLNLKHRTSEFELLLRIGYSKKQLLNLQIAEISGVAVLSASIGTLLSIPYSYLMVSALNSVWYGAVQTNALKVYVTSIALFYGFISVIIISFLTLYFSLKKAKLGSESGKISKETKITETKTNWSFISASVGFFIGIGLTAFALFTGQSGNSSLFLSSGGILLVAGILWVNFYLSKFQYKIKSGNNSLTDLAMRNAAFFKFRTLAVLILFAIGVFSIIITGANRRTFSETANNKPSGTGGFEYWAEFSVPVLGNFNDVETKTKYNFDEVMHANLFHFEHIKATDGDDAGCLNQNKITNPRILGVPNQSFFENSNFSFASNLVTIPEDSIWLELSNRYAKNTIPAVIDQTVLQWGIQRKLGDTLVYLNEKGEVLNLVLVAGIQNSIFQGNVLISEKHFNANFPSIAGNKILLLESKSDTLQALNQSINYTFGEYGIELESTRQRLSNFYSVTNTYLNVFLMLGFFGLVIGTFGLGIAIIRNLADRTAEIGLLQAIGFSKKKIFKLIFVEQAYILAASFLIASISALVGILPSLLSNSYSFSGIYLLLLVLVIAISSFLILYFSIKFGLKKNVINNLRVE